MNDLTPTPKITASRPYCERRYGGSYRGRGARRYSTRSIYVDGVQVGYWECWNRMWEVDWKFIRKGINVGALHVEDNSSATFREPTETEFAEWRVSERAVTETIWN